VIHVLDQLSVRPGHLATVRARIVDDYRPVVADLGVRLAGFWTAPPVELLDDPTDLVALWELDDVGTYWKFKQAAARDPRVLAFWDGIGPMLAGRRRRIMAPVAVPSSADGDTAAVTDGEVSSR